MIEFSHVSKLFGAQKAVNDLNLNFQEGSFSVLIGTSGSGKSTTLKMINRLVEHDSGVIRFAGEEIRSLPVLELRRRMGYAIQSIGLFPHWSVAQNIATVPQLQKWSRARIDDRIDELMALLGLESNLRERYPHQLSGGQQQRVGVSTCHSHTPIWAARIANCSRCSVSYCSVMSRTMARMPLSSPCSLRIGL